MPETNDEMLIGIVITVFVFLIIGFFILILVAYINHRKKKHIEEKQEMQTHFQQELMQAQLEIQEQTMKNISQEIHDNIGQVLSLAKLNLNIYDTTLTEPTREKIDSSRILVGKAIKDLRDLSKSMNTDYVTEMGFIRALEYEIEMIGKTGQFQASISVEGTTKKMGKNAELILFRIVQELLNNSMKHSKATQISIAVCYQNDAMELRLKDDGQGFNLSLLEKSEKGIGIRNMRSRASLIGAQMKICSEPGQGTDTIILLPLTA